MMMATHLHACLLYLALAPRLGIASMEWYLEDDPWGALQEAVRADSMLEMLADLGEIAIVGGFD
jgi:hypothetical protein